MLPIPSLIIAASYYAIAANFIATSRWIKEASTKRALYISIAFVLTGGVSHTFEALGAGLRWHWMTAVIAAYSAVGLIFFTWRKILPEKLDLEKQVFVNKIQQAILDHDFTLYYHPFCDLNSGELVGYEALIRWPQPDGSIKMPAEFLPLIEYTDAMSSLCYLVIRMACQALANHPELNVAINLSPNTIAERHFESSFNEILDELDIDRCRLDLEITERVAAEASIAPRLQRFQKIGHRIGLDDFGTGYSSLAELANLPIDIIKIDRSFIVNIEHDPDMQELVRAILGIAKTLNLRTIAEGVESEFVLEWLRAEGCDYGQGYYWGKPKPLNEIFSIPPSP